MVWTCLSPIIIIINAGSNLHNIFFSFIRRHFLKQLSHGLIDLHSGLEITGSIRKNT